MLLAVFSDSHGRGAEMRRAVAEHRPDQIVFLGDGIRDAEALSREFPAIPAVILRGNCDYDDYQHDISAMFTLERVKIFAAHGHRHNVKLGMDGFLNSVCCSGAALGLYGHTHCARITEAQGVTLMNPGSVGDRLCPSYGLVQIENGIFSCRIVQPDQGTGEDGFAGRRAGQ